MRKLQIIASATLFSLLLAACGATPSAAPTPTSAPVATSLPPAPSPVPTAAAVEGAPIDLAQANLAAALGMRLDQLQFQAAEPIQWNNSALGCPAPDTAYTEVIVDGYRLFFSDGVVSYVVHSDLVGTRLILCQNALPSPLDGSLLTPDNPLVGLPGGQLGGAMNMSQAEILTLAQARAASDLGVVPNTLTTISSQAVTWTDGSLGCPEPGTMYTQALVDGYRFVFADGNRQIEIHSDTNGMLVVCDQVFPDNQVPGMIDNS